MKKCTVIGKFAFKEHIMDGQTVKCSTIYNELSEKYGKDEITYIDTYNWKKKPLKMFINCVKAMKNSYNVIMLPAHNGVKVFGPLISFLKRIYKRKIHYIVIGSWLFDKVKSSKILRKSLLRFDAIYVETSLLKDSLENIGFNNVYKMNNYKKIEIINVKELQPYENKRILRTCIFSRINYEKGIEDAIDVLNKINSKEIIVSLDIYGPVEKTFSDRFEELISKNSDFSSYKGIIDSSKSVETIKDYDVVLFPTKYKTEGIPGTVIDAFAAGVPVLSSSWDNFKDIIDDGKTGIVFNFGDIDNFEDKLLFIYNNQDKVYKMKKNCITKAKEFCSVDALDDLFKKIDGD